MSLLVSPYLVTCLIAVDSEWQSIEDLNISLIVSEALANSILVG